MSLFLGLLGCKVIPSAQAEIYRWQDAQGRWHFSDAPQDKQTPGARVIGGDKPDRATTVTPSDVHSSRDDERLPLQDLPPERDIQARFERSYADGSVVEKVTLAVVGVETAMGLGSAFFVSEDGYLITNKHVVRPNTTRDAEKVAEDLLAAKKKLQEFRDHLQEERRYLDEYQKKLDSYRQDLTKRTGAQNALDWQEYRDYESRHQQRLAEYRENEALYQKQQRELQQQRDEFNFKSSLAGASRRFKIFLKDNTALEAELVSLSKRYDLALLKLHEHRVPILKPARDERAAQGSVVFAVGSPMGMRDSVTRGIVARLDADYVVTDAQILPGNSGGPLVNEQGEVVGVNTFKFANNVMADGFGLAIPVKVVHEEFAAWISSWKE